MNRVYKYISLVAAKLVGRRHERDIEPPGMKELENAFISRSDSAITSRPDFNVVSESIPAITENMVFSNGANEDDYLNSVVGMYGSDDSVYMSSYAPIGVVDGELQYINSEYATGTVSCTSGESTLTGVGTSWLQEVWRGCLLTFPDDSSLNVYKVTEVGSDTSLTIDGVFADTYSGVGYSLRRCHQFYHSDYKLNIQPYTSGIIYSCPTLGSAVEPSNICGPFYSNITSSTSTSTDTTGYTETSSGYVVYADDTDNGGLPIWNYPVRSLLYDGYHAWMCYVPITAGTSKVMRTTTPSGGPWYDAVVPPSTSHGYNSSSHSEMCQVDGRVFLSIVKNTGEYGISYTDDWGTSWTTEENADAAAANTTTGSGTGQVLGVMSPTTAGGRILLWSSGSSHHQVWYSDDSFSTWTRSTDTGAGSWVAGQIWGGNYCGGKYVLICGSTAYGSDDATDQSWTQTALGASGFNQVVYDEDGGYWLFLDESSGVIKKVSTWGTVAATTTVSGYTNFRGAVWAGDRIIIFAEKSTGGGVVLSTTNGIDVTLEYEYPGGQSNWTPHYSDGLLVCRSSGSDNYAHFASASLFAPNDNFGPRSILNTSQTYGMTVWNSGGSKAIITTTDVTDHTSWAECTQVFDFGYGDDGIVPMVQQRIEAGDPDIYKVVGGKQVSTDTWGFIYTDDHGVTWTAKAIAGRSGAVTTFAAGPMSGSTDIYHIAAGESAQTAYYTTDFWDTSAEVTGLSITGSDYIVAIRQGLVGIEQHKTTRQQGFVILTREGKVYVSLDGSSFSLRCTLDSTSESWYDCTFIGLSGGSYKCRFLQNVSATHSDKPIADVFYVGDTSLGDDDDINYTGDPARYQYLCLAPYLSFANSNGIYSYVDRDTDDGKISRIGAGSPISLGVGNKAYCIEGGFSPKTVLAYYITDTEDRFYTFVSQLETGEVTWSSPLFEPLSNEHRALSHSVLDGYVMLVGVSDWDDEANIWVYYPRRIRWTTPLTFNDFDSEGAGTAELDGNGSLLDSRSVNGRIVIFESSSIGSISPRGYADDPWEYDSIKDNIRSISNPVVVDDLCYFIDDSGLLRATNGMTVESPPFSFDLTEYDDFNSDVPIWLTYSPELEALAIYNPNSSDRHVYCVEPESGAVSRLKIAAVDGESPKSLVCVESSSDRRMMISFNPNSADNSELTVAELSTGGIISGIDEWTSDVADDTFHVTDIQTPQVFIVQEGMKTGIKHLLVNTYTDGTTLATNPILVVQCKSLEDSAWHDNGDTNGTITVDDSTCTGVGTAWSNTIGANGSTVYTLPCLATQARVYVGSTLQVLNTDYTITDTKEITFGSATSDTVYAYWENEPTPVVSVGDMIQTTEGWHRITGINTATSLNLDHYLSTGSDATATHHFGTAIPSGDGETKIGISKLVEGAKLRFLIIHRSDGDATVTKITGFSIGHFPAGEKIVEP